MTTITVVKKDGHAAIAADSLTTYGSRKETADYVASHEKIFRIRDSYIAVAGPAAAGRILRHHFAKLGDKVRLDGADSIFDTWLRLHGALKERYFLQPEENEEDSFESSRMDVLIANPHGIFAVDAHRSVEEFARFYAFGYGQDYALGAMFAIFDDPAKSAEEIARFGVQAAAEFDSSTAAPIHSASVRLKKSRGGPRRQPL